MRKLARSVLTIFSLFSLVLGGGMAQASTSPKEVVLFQAKMKSEKELMEDALAGKRDPGLENIKIEAQALDENGKKIDVNLKKYYTVQKLTQIKKGDEITTDFVVLGSVVWDDPKSNPGVNFSQNITGYFTTTSIGTAGYVKATRYEAQYTLHDGNLLQITNAVFNARTEGLTPSGQTINQKNPTPISPVNWGQTYVKSPSWDYIRLSGFGYCEGTLTTNYTVRSSSGTLVSDVLVGNKQ